MTGRAELSGTVVIMSGRRRPLRAAVVVCMVATAGLGSWSSVAGAVSGVAVSGVVYRDLNNSGVQDPGEPGVPGIRVHSNAGAGTPTTTTGPNGAYSLSGVPAGGVGSLVVETGWFRSQCARLSCATGPGADNDYLTTNQFIQYPLSSVMQNMSGLDVGLLPDWPGHASAPVLELGSVPANSVDVAARLSWVTSSCSDGKYFICRPGDGYTVSVQFLNQGTTAITGLHAVLALPPGDQLATGDPSRDLVLNAPATSPGVTGMTAGPVSDDSIIPMSFAGTLVPGGLVKVTGRLVAGGTVGTPGCVRGSPTAICPTGEPFAAPLILGITHVDQSGDPDSFGPGCDAETDVRQCPTGIHDKQVEPDEVDPVGHNVDASVGSNETYDLRSKVDVLSALPAGGWRAGLPITWRVSAFNDGPAMSGSGWALTLVLPLSSKPSVPMSNAMRTCAKGTSTSGYPFVRCTGHGPLSPGVTSIAIDVATVVPAGTRSGAQLAVAVYVEPAGGQVPETNPLGLAPTSPSVNTTSTPTDNDNSAVIDVD